MRGWGAVIERPTAQAEHDVADFMRLEAENAELAGRLQDALDRADSLEGQLAEASDRADRNAKRADAIAEGADELIAQALPRLADLHPGFDEPIPADARISRKGDGRLCGSWEPVPGDRAADWPEVPAVDFTALYELIDGTLGVAA